MHSMVVYGRLTFVEASDVLDSLSVEISVLVSTVELKLSSFYNIFSGGYETDEFGCRASCECGRSTTIGDMTVVREESFISTKSGQSNFVPQHFKPWDDFFKDGKYLIPYKIDKKIANNHRAEVALNTAFEKIESNSSLKFIEQTDEERYLFFNDGDGCRSYIGQQKKIGPQDIILGPGCYYYFTVIHEVSFLFRL